MDILSFKAFDVHGYIDFDIKLNSDVTFIAGLNGSGKTSALKLIMALLTPSFEQLNDILFSSTELVMRKRDGDIIKITCVQDQEHLMMKISGISEELNLDKNELDYDLVRGRRKKMNRHPVVKEISRMPSPMFLSLDRRFVKGTRNNDEFDVFFDDEYEKIIHRKKSHNDESLNEVLKIISDYSSECHAKQVNEDKQLRNKIILDSFSLQESNKIQKIPNHGTVEKLRLKQIAIKNTLDTLDVPSEEFEKKYEKFFTKLEMLAKKISDTEHKEKVSDGNEGDEFKKAMSEWFINQNQLVRIDRLFSMVEKYQTAKKKIYQNLNDFEKLVNKFLIQTDKLIRVNQVGDVKIKIKNKERDLTVLSSGERQILIMIAHLVLNKRLPKDGVFIVDEPELSLHLSWQDMFVEAIQQASPKLQIILATHSPAIIGGRNNKYVPLNGGI